MTERSSASSKVRICWCVRASARLPCLLPPPRGRGWGEVSVALFDGDKTFSRIPHIIFAKILSLYPMIENSANYLTGRLAIGFRFRFINKAISRCALYLPIGMKENAQVQALLEGVQPKKVFATDDIHKARRCFNEIRCNYDFNYWPSTNTISAT